MQVYLIYQHDGIRMMILLMLQLKDIRKLFIILCTAPLGVTDNLKF